MKKRTITFLAVALVLIVAGVGLCAVAVDMGAQPKTLFSDGTFSMDLDDFEIGFDDDGFGIRDSRNDDINISNWPDGGSKKEAAVNELVISWTSGSVSIVGADVDKVTFSESAEGGIEADEAMEYRVEGNTLHIDYCQDGFYFGIGDSMPAKDIVVTVPVSFGRILVETVSAEVKIQDVEISGVLKVDTTSGAASAGGVSVSSAEFDSVSGNVFFGGSAREFEADTTSANVEAAFESLPKEFEADTVSGNVYLSIPEGSSFEIEFDTVSGRLSSEIEVLMWDGEYISGSGGAEMNVSTVSGDCIIKKK